MKTKFLLLTFALFFQISTIPQTASGDDKATAKEKCVASTIKQTIQDLHRKLNDVICLKEPFAGGDKCKRDQFSKAWTSNDTSKDKVSDLKEKFEKLESFTTSINKWAKKKEFRVPTTYHVTQLPKEDRAKTAGSCKVSQSGFVTFTDEVCNAIGKFGEKEESFLSLDAATMEAKLKKDEYLCEHFDSIAKSAEDRISFVRREYFDKSTLAKVDCYAASYVYSVDGKSPLGNLLIQANNDPSGTLKTLQTKPLNADGRNVTLNFAENVFTSVQWITSPLMTQFSRQNVMLANQVSNLGQLHPVSSFASMLFVLQQTVGQDAADCCASGGRQNCVDRRPSSVPVAPGETPSSAISK